MMIIGFSLALFFVLKYLAIEMPSFEKDRLISKESSVIYDTNNDEIIEIGSFLRSNVSYEQLPEVLINAFLSIEDSRFFKHNGLDIPRFLKASYTTFIKKDHTQGGSTIDMQLVKNSYFVDDEQELLPARSGIEGLRRKFHEIILALKANQSLDKKTILVNYLNKLNFGNRIRGVQKASEYYFGKNVSELNLPDAALLAGIINLPNAYNPYFHLNEAKLKRDEVLDSMHYHGYINDLELNLAKKVKIEDTLYGYDGRFEHTNILYQSYIDRVINEAIEITGLNPYHHSMKIYTSMDPDLQKLFYNIQNDKTDIEFPRKEIQNALVLMDNKNGEILALGGGRFNKNEARLLNRATDSYISPGSSVKPILDYALAFDRLGWSSNHIVTDRPILFRDSDIVVANYDREYRGDVYVNSAVEDSLNTTAITALNDVIDAIGAKEVVKYLNDIGFKVKESEFNDQFAIGAQNFLCTPLQLAGAHAMLFNEGRYIKPYTIKKIVFGDKNKETYIADNKGKQVISPAAAYLTALSEKAVVYGPSPNTTKSVKYRNDGSLRSYPIYAKTGTSDWGDSGVQYGIPRGASKDLLNVFSNNKYTFVSWRGFDKAEEGVKTWFSGYDYNFNTGTEIARLIFDNIEDKFVDKNNEYQVEELKKPDDLVEIRHVPGVFPYKQNGSYLITSLIDKRYLEKQVEPKNNYQGSNHYNFKAEIKDNNIIAAFSGFNGCIQSADGKLYKDISLITSKHFVPAVGNCIYGYPISANFNVRILYNNIETENHTVDFPTMSIPISGEGSIIVCGTADINGEVKPENCVQIR